MASHSSQPEDPDKLKKSVNKLDQQTEKQKDQPTEGLDNDQDFWSMDADNSEIDKISDELENILTDSSLVPPIPLPLSGATSKAAIELEDLGGEEIIKNLEKANSKEQNVSVSTLSDKDIEAYNAQELEEQERAVKQQSQKKESKQKLLLYEKISIGLCFLFLVGLGVYCYSYYNDHFDIKTEEEWVTNIPVEGKHAEISSIETWWSPPIKKAKLGVKLVPTIKITLGENSNSGALRVIFFSFEEGLNGNNRAKGDPIPLVFNNGKFENGKNTVTLQCTDGFKSIAEFNAYRNQSNDPKKVDQSEKRWTVMIKEASNINTNSEEYQDLGHAPIDPIRSASKAELDAKK